jgi:hypothetical protein
VSRVRMRETHGVVTRITDEAVALAMGAFCVGSKPVVDLALVHVYYCNFLANTWKDRRY